ncbi:MAG: CCA tRNA nucleotidyltransferase [Patescibacteria group bacterium]|nr:CCA tRNA nucleotidyltransferase [Patescibacteria group bacterium]
MVSKFSIPEEVTRITKSLKKGGFQAYLVGGCVRDLVAGLKPKDWDITTNARPEEIAALFPKTFYENDYGTVSVVNEECEDKSIRCVEITPFRLEAKYSDQRRPDEVTWSNNLEDDLKRRDFTVNALALDQDENKVIDLYSGQEDLKDKLIRAVGDPDERLSEDSLRILRGIRLATQLNFAIESETATSISKNAHLLKIISAERIREEFIRIIMTDQPMIGLVLANKLGVLREFLPELEEGIHVKQNGDHMYEVWEHSLRALQHSADRKYPLHVRLAALFHDIGKPRTRKWGDEKKDWTFYGHDVVGARTARQVLERLKFPKKTTDLIAKLVRNHMFFTDIEKITLSAVRRIIRNVGREEVWDLMSVRMCDRIGMGRPKESPYRLRKYESMIEEALRAPTSVTMLKIDGDNVIHETGLEAGPKIGHILHALLEETLDKPENNETDKLIARAKELAKLDKKELKKMGEGGKEKKEKIEQAEISKIRSKYGVK